MEVEFEKDHIGMWSLYGTIQLGATMDGFRYGPTFSKRIEYCSPTISNSKFSEIRKLLTADFRLYRNNFIVNNRLESFFVVSKLENPIQAHIH